jgi:hypothetical protein
MHIYVNIKMRHVETILGMGEGWIKENDVQSGVLLIKRHESCIEKKHETIAMRLTL